MTEILSRMDARERGIKTYFTGRACVRGHISHRRTGSCACVSCDNAEVRDRLRKANRAHPERFRRYRLKQRLNNPIGLLLRGARRRAKQYGLPFALSQSDIMIPPNCPCCGQVIAVNNSFDRARSESPSLDRIEPRLGYIPSNVAVICWRCNNLKSNATAQELRIIADWIDREVILRGGPNVAEIGKRWLGKLSLVSS